MKQPLTSIASFHTHLFATLFLLGFISFFQSCTTMNIAVQHDEVTSKERIKGTFHYSALENNCPLRSAEQTILIEHDAMNDVTYEVYDVLTMDGDSYRLKDQVYLVFGEEVFPIAIDHQETEIVTKFSEKTEKIRKADSTLVNVITGYDHSDLKIAKISYRLPAEAVDKIKYADEFRFRYYAGPEMITTRLRGIPLSRLKKMIHMNP